MRVVLIVGISSIGVVLVVLLVLCIKLGSVKKRFEVNNRDRLSRASLEPRPSHNF